MVISSQCFHRQLLVSTKIQCTPGNEAQEEHLIKVSSLWRRSRTSENAVSQYRELFVILESLAATFNLAP